MVVLQKKSADSLGCQFKLECGFRADGWCGVEGGRSDG
jgi:hypothetical protein